jgi:predicted PurR-regulated permease PerM
MSPDSENNSQLHAIIGENRDIMHRLNETIGGLNDRQAKSSGFLWASLLVPLLLSLLLLYLIYSISNQAESLPAGLQGENARMERMEESLTLMTTNLEEIQAAMLSINGYMQCEFTVRVYPRFH